MKTKISIMTIIFIFAFAGLSMAQNWIAANQATVAWDAVAYQLDTGERLIYRAYLANAKTDPDKANPALIGETEALEYQFTFTEKGSYFVGLKAVIQALAEDGATWQDVAESEFGWSDDPTFAQAGATFGLRFYPAPVAPVGMRPVID